MPVDVVTTIEIARRRAEVAASAPDPGNAMRRANRKDLEQLKAIPEG